MIFMCIFTYNRYPLCTTPKFVCICEAVLETKHADVRTLHLCRRTSAPFWQDLVSWNPQ